MEDSDSPHRLSALALAILQLGTASPPSAPQVDPDHLWAESLQKSSNLIVWLAMQVAGVPLKAGLRTRVVAVCFGVAQDHLAGMVTLLGGVAPNYSSAAALLRPQFEAYVRGMWLALLATDVQFERYVNGGATPNMPAMIDAIGKIPEQGSWPAVRRVYDGMWGELSGFTHTGIAHLKRWSSDGVLQPAYDPLELVGMMDFASRIALLSTAGLALLSTVDGLPSRILQEGKARLPPKR